MTNPVTQRPYLVASGTGTIFPTVVFHRAPAVTDFNFPVTQRWIDTSNGNAEWFLLGFTSSAGVVSPNWVQLASGSFTTESLTGNTGGAVFPNGSLNINVVGDSSGIQFAGNPGTNTLTASLANIPNSSLAHSSISLVAGTGITITTSPVSLGGSTTIGIVSTWADVNALLVTGTTTTGAVQDIPSVATGQVLISQGTSTKPAYSATPSVTSVTVGGGTALGTYVEGTWTPVLAFGGSTTGFVYSQQFGKYTQIGNKVFITADITLTNAGSGTGGVTFSGLPVACGSIGAVGNIIFELQQLTPITSAGVTSYLVEINNSATTGAFIVYNAATGGIAAMTTANTTWTNTTTCRFQGFYFTS